MRTIKRFSRPLNPGKWKDIQSIAERYAGEKDDHLISMGSPKWFSHYPTQRMKRDELVQSKYKSRHHLQARQWKMALKESFETIDKQWLTISASLKGFIYERQWNEAQKHYGFWLIQTSQRMSLLMTGKTIIPTHFDISAKEYRTVRNTLHRKISQLSFQSPRVKIARSFTLDNDMYELFEHKGRQYIKIMSLIRGKRIIIPLTGKTPIKGNIRVVLDSDKHRIEIHYTAKLKKTKRLKGDVCGLDAGITEVFTDEQNNRYGLGFGEKISTLSEQLKDKGKKRNQLHRREKEVQDPKRKRNLRKFNLGQQKQKQCRKKFRITIEREINHAINQVLKKRQPKRMIVENLDFRGKAKSRLMSRLVHLWMRKLLKERTEFKASVGGSSRKAVNPAYSSQTCPQCYYVDAKNRTGDKFQCGHCLHEDFADRVGADNLKARDRDTEITLFTPKARVKSILLGRFNALLESATSE